MNMWREIWRRGERNRDVERYGDVERDMKMWREI